MANWNSMTITNAGLALQAKINTGAATFHIAGIAIGSGTVQGSLAAATELAHKEMDVPISKVAANNNIVSIEGTITNTDVTAAFAIREMGLYAQDGDNADTKILYGIMTDPNPDSLPAHGSATVVSQKFTLNLTMSNTGNVTATIDPNALVTVKVLDKHNTNAEAHANLVRVKSMTTTETGISYVTQDNKSHSIGLWDTLKKALTGSFTADGNKNTLTQQMEGIAGLIKKITGETNWYDSPSASMKTLAEQMSGVSAIADYDFSNKNAWWAKFRGAPGLIIQGGVDTKKFPIKFPHTAIGICAGGEYSADYRDNNVQLTGSSESFQMSHGNGGLRIFWIAIGY